MADRSYLAWPFLDDAHRALADELDAWARAEVGGLAEPGEDELDAHCRDLVAPEALLDDARALAESLAAGPNFAHGMTKTMLDQEWAMSIETAIEAEAQAQAICMQTRDFERAYRAFLARERPAFEGD